MNLTKSLKSPHQRTAAVVVEMGKRIKQRRSIKIGDKSLIDHDTSVIPVTTFLTYFEKARDLRIQLGISLLLELLEGVKMDL